MGEEVMMRDDGSFDSRGEGSVLINSVIKENEIPDVDFLKDLDFYLDDVNDRLRVSRPVSDSLKRGLLIATELEAAEKVGHEELEWSRLRESLLQYHEGSEENEASYSDLIHDKVCLNPLNAKDRGSLDTLKYEVENQLEMLREELADIRRLVQVNRADPSHKIFGLGNVQHEKGSTKRIDVDGMLDLLKRILDVAFKQKNEMELLSSWQQEHDYQKEIELLVVTSFVQSLRDEYEQRLWEQSAEFCGKRSLMRERTKEIAGLRQELKLISKLFSGHANRDVKDWEIGNQKRTEQLHQKVPQSLIPASSLWDSNVKYIASVTSSPENLEALKQFTHEQLVNYIKTEMNQMKREQDYAIQEITEQYYSFKRKYLNLEERNSFLSFKKHNEFDVMQKKIPYMISKLDKILLEDEELVFEGKNNAHFQSQLDSLLLENCQLRESLSKADQKISQISQVESNHQKLIEKLKPDVEDSRIRDSVFADVYGSFVDQIQCAKEETNSKHSIMRDAYELISRDHVSRDASENKDELDGCCVESYMTEKWCAVIYKEALKEADKKLGDLNMYVLEKEQALSSEMVEKEKLKKEIHCLGCHVKEKENLVWIAENDLETERERIKIAFQQINDLQSQINQQEAMIQDKNKELKVVSAHALEKVEGYEMEMSKLRQELELTKNEKRMSDLKLSSSEAKQKKLEDQFASLVLILAKLNKEFVNLECFVAEETKMKSSRLKSIQGQVSDLVNEVNEIKRKASRYKQRLEKEACDLQKAETEVDLLGDEVESLLNLLEKIYIALDHYSPILKHYSGIIEILKLVWRQLSGESKRLSIL